MVEHEICLLTSAFNHIGHVHNTGEVPLDNARVLGNLCEYRHKSYIAKTRFVGLHFCRRQHRSMFNHFDVIGPNSVK